MKERLFCVHVLAASILLITLFSSQLSIAEYATCIHAIQLTDYPSQINVGDLMTIKGWVTFTQSITYYPVYVVLVIEGSKMQGSGEWLPEGTVPEKAIQLGTYTYDGNIRWVWYVPEIDNGVTYTIYALDRETAKIKSNTLTYTAGGGTAYTTPSPWPIDTVVISNSQSRVISLYESILDTDSQTLIKILRETGTKIIFRGYFRWGKEDLRVYDRLAERIREIKGAMPRIKIIGAITCAAFVDGDCWPDGKIVSENEKEDMLWYLSDGRRPRHMADPESYLLDIAKPLAGKFILAYAYKLVDVGFDILWFDEIQYVPWWSEWTYDIQVSYDPYKNAWREIAHEIKNYAKTKYGKDLLVSLNNGWINAIGEPQGRSLTPWPDQDFITISFGMKTVHTQSMQDDWKEYKSLVVEVYSKLIPIVAFLDWGKPPTPLSIFGNLAVDQQISMLEKLHNACLKEDLLFVYPLHGGLISNYLDPPYQFVVYDAIQRGTYATIRSLINPTAKYSDNLWRTTNGEVFSDNFDAETAGNNPSNWYIEEPENTDVCISDQVYHGSSGKSMKIYDNNNKAGTNVLALKMYDNQPDVIHEWAARPAQTNCFVGMSTYVDGTILTSVNFDSDGNIKHYEGSWPALVISSYNADTWHVFKIVPDFNNNRYDMYIDNLLVVEDIPFQNSGYAFDEMFFHTADIHLGSLYVDDVKVYRSENITINNLQNGQKFNIRKSGGVVVATSEAGSDGFASIDISSLSDRPPYQDMQIIDTDGAAVIWTMSFDHENYNDIWGGDIYYFISSNSSYPTLTITGIDKQTVTNAITKTIAEAISVTSETNHSDAYYQTAIMTVLVLPALITIRQMGVKATKDKRD